jgi:integrase/recombinase XerD
MGLCNWQRFPTRNGVHHDAPSEEGDRGQAGLESFTESYLQQVSLFARHFGKSPRLLGPEEIRSYQRYLTNEEKLAIGSIHIAIAALRFLYEVTLKEDWILAEVIRLPRKPQKRPVVLSLEEVLHFLTCVQLWKHRVFLTTCYGAGLRVSEAVRLRPTAIGSRRMVIVIVCGKAARTGT